MGFLDLLFPRTCLECGRHGVYICKRCVSKLPEVKQICPMCTRPSIDGFTHPRCTKPHGLDGLSVLFPYKGIIRKSLLSMKYKFAADISDELTLVCVQKSKELVVFDESRLLVPIPLAKKRENWRGFNQASLVGERLSHKMKWKYYDRVLVRKSFSKAQTDLDKDARQKNIKGAFGYSKSSTDKSTPIILFDDVWTTGSTLREACKVLKRNGHKNVWGLTVGR